jgi:hypothetical protein
MKDIKGFCKLFDINIPEYSEFDYYINQLSKTWRWKNIKDLIKLYQEAESEINDIYQFRMDKSNEIIDFIRSTRAFSELNDDNLINDYPTTKNFTYDSSKRYLSVDIKMANWTTLKRYDPDFLNELGNSYEELLEKFGLSEIFKYSKSLRQYIFGNLNPKRQIKFQRKIIEDLIQEYKHLNLKTVCIKNDEIIWEIDCNQKLNNILSTIDNNLFKTKLFEVDRVDDFKIHSYYDNLGKFLYKEMVGCNGNLFYINLKKYILDEEIDIRDLYFRMDGNLAIWNYEGLKLELKIK